MRGEPPECGWRKASDDDASPLATPPPHRQPRHEPRRQPRQPRHQPHHPPRHQHTRFQPPDSVIRWTSGRYAWPRCSVSTCEYNLDSAAVAVAVVRMRLCASGASARVFACVGMWFVCPMASRRGRPRLFMFVASLRELWHVACWLQDRLDKRTGGACPLFMFPVRR